MRIAMTIVASLLAAILAGCGRDAATAAPVLDEITWAAEDGEPDGLPAFERPSDDVAYGGRPVGEEGYRVLAGLGYQTVLSVEGRAPDVRSASMFGLRIVHVPLDFGEVSETAVRQIVYAARTAKGPVYVCDADGGARALAAATLVRLDLDELPKREAMANAEALRGHGGLFLAVQRFESPDEDLVEHLEEAVEPTGLKAAMLEIEPLWDALTEARDAGFGDRRASTERAMQIAALLDTVAGGPQDVKQRANFLRTLREAGVSGRLLGSAIHRREPEKAERAYRRLEQGCIACHRQHR